MTAKTYKEAISVITIANHLTALRNFTDPRKNIFKFIFSWIYNVSLITAISIIIMFFEIREIGEISFGIKTVIYSVVMTSNIIGFVCVTISGLYNSKDMLALIKHINKMDETFKKLGAKIDYRDLFRRVTILGFFWILLGLLIIQFYYAQFLNKRISLTQFLFYTSYIYVINVGSIVLYDFKIVVNWLGIRFKQTNELLGTFLMEGRQSKRGEPKEEILLRPTHNFQNRFRLDEWFSQHSIHSTAHPITNVSNLKEEPQSIKNVHSLQQIRLIHLKLCRVSKMLNRIFDTQVLFYVFLALIYVIVVLNTLYVISHKPDTLKQVLYMFLLFALDVINNCFKIGIVSYNCEYTMSEANKAIEIIHAYSVDEMDTDFKDEIVQFCLQMSYVRLRKSNSASFRLNYSFICECVSFVSTYLTIVMQSSQM